MSWHVFDELYNIQFVLKFINNINLVFCVFVKLKCILKETKLRLNHQTKLSYFQVTEYLNDQ